MTLTVDARSADGGGGARSRLAGHHRPARGRMWLLLVAGSGDELLDQVIANAVITPGLVLYFGHLSDQLQYLSDLAQAL